jgi:hypothetical protein
MGLFSNIGEFLFGKGPDTEAAQSALASGNQDALANIVMGLNQAQGTLQPMIDQSTGYNSKIANMLMGKTDPTTIPGYNAMTNARREAVGDLGTGMAGTGKFFSGSTAEGAANIGGSMQNQLMQQYLSNLMMGAQPGNQAATNLAGMQMGGGTSGANIMAGGGANMANMIMADQSEGVFGDILGAAATLGGAYLGGKGNKGGGNG